MNTNLLKKIKKRFSWYKNKAGVLILIDHNYKSASTVDAERLKGEFPNFSDDKINEDSLFRYMKLLMTRPFVSDYLGKINYRFASRVIKNK